MQLTLKHFQRHTEGEPGDHMVAEIQQMGDDATRTDTTDIIVDTSEGHRDIRIADGDKILKVRLDREYKIQGVLENDVPLRSD